MADEEYILRHYKCPYCNQEFDRKVKRHESKFKRSNYSSAVECGCGNFLKTWS